MKEANILQKYVTKKKEINAEERRKKEYVEKGETSKVEKSNEKLEKWNEQLN